jgi:hypothetical protein
MARQAMKKAKDSQNIIVGLYPTKKKVSLRHYIRAYGLKVSDVKKVAKEIGIEPCLSGK